MNEFFSLPELIPLPRMSASPTIIMRTANFFTLTLIAIGLFAITISGIQARTIHYFGIFCDGYRGDSGVINEGVTKDKLIMESLFHSNYSEAAWQTKLTMHSVSKDRATEAEVWRYLNGLAPQVGSDDTVYIHFSGHGVILDQSRGEQYLLDVNEKAFSREAIADWMEGLPCRLRILVTDCCSTYPQSFFVAEGDEEVLPWNNLYSLLVQHEGFVNITAASPGQPAYGTSEGGFLTINLHSDMQRYPTWRQVFQQTRDRVRGETRQIIESKRGAQPSFLGGHYRVIIDTSVALRSGADPLTLVQVPLSYSLGNLIEGNEPRVMEFVMPDSNQRRLTRDELRTLHHQQLYLARNEILARHGYDFNSETLEKYFLGMPWYRKRPGFKSPRLSEIERYNADLINEVEKEKGGSYVVGPRDTNNQATGEFIFPHSSTQTLPRTAVQALSPRELSIARNEIYARHGFSFSTPALRSYFSQKNFYRPRTESEPDFNAVEEQNLWLIRKIERIKGGPYQW